MPPPHAQDTVRPQKGTQPCVPFRTISFLFKHRIEGYAFKYTKINFQKPNMLNSEIKITTRRFKKKDLIFTLGEDKFVYLPWSSHWRPSLRNFFVPEKNTGFILSPKFGSFHETRFRRALSASNQWEGMRLAFTNKGEGNLSDARSSMPVNLSRWQEVVQRHQKEVARMMRAGLSTYPHGGYWRVPESINLSPSWTELKNINTNLLRFT